MVNLVAEGSGDILGTLPSSAASLQPDAEVWYGEVDGATVKYKVESVRYVAEHDSVPTTGPSRYSVYGRTDLIVSVV